MRAHPACPSTLASQAGGMAPPQDAHGPGAWRAAVHVRLNSIAHHLQAARQQSRQQPIVLNGGVLSDSEAAQNLVSPQVAPAPAAAGAAKVAVLAGSIGLGVAIKHAYPSHHPPSKQNAKIVPKSSTVDPQWITAALHASGTLPPEAEVHEAQVVPVKVKITGWESMSTEDDGSMVNGGGMSGAGLVRVADIVYSGNMAHGAPSTMVHKWSAVGDSQNRSWPALDSGLDWPLPNPKKWLSNVMKRREAMKPGGFGRWHEHSIRREALFYSQVAPEMHSCGVRVPACFHVGLDGPQKPTPDYLYLLARWQTKLRMSLLLEDLNSAGFVSGFSTGVLQPGQATLVVRAAARLHAWGWDKLDTILGESSAMCVNMRGTFDPADMAAFETDDRLSACIERALHSEHEELAQFFKDPEVIQLMWRLRKDTPHWLARRKAVPDAQTILHGDLHTGNTMLRQPSDNATSDAKDPMSVCLVDWQCFGAGPVAAELLYFLDARNGWGGKAEQQDSQPVESDEELLSAYHAELSSRGGVKVSGFTLAQLKCDVAAMRVEAFARGLAHACDPERIEEEEKWMAGLNTAKRAQHMAGRVRRARQDTDRIASLYADTEIRSTVFEGKF